MEKPNDRISGFKSDVFHTFSAGADQYSITPLCFYRYSQLTLNTPKGRGFLNLSTHGIEGGYYDTR